MRLRAAIESEASIEVEVAFTTSPSDTLFRAPAGVSKANALKNISRPRSCTDMRTYVPIADDWVLRRRKFSSSLRRSDKMASIGGFLFKTEAEAEYVLYHEPPWPELR